MSRRIGELVAGEKEFKCCACGSIKETYFMTWMISVPYEQPVVVFFCSDECEEKTKTVFDLPKYSCSRPIRQMLKDAGNLSYPYEEREKDFGLPLDS